MVYTSYRTGSTALCDNLSTQTGYKNFDEAYHPNQEQKKFRDRYNEFVEYKKHKSTFVWKLMPDQIRTNNKDDIFTTWNRSYRIKLIRNDIIGQIASWYTCALTDFWHQTASEKMPRHSLRIDPNIMLACCQRILWNNHQLNKLPENKFHQILAYEDLENIDSVYEPRNRPENYDEILECVEHTLIDNKLAEKKNV